MNYLISLFTGLDTTTLLVPAAFVFGCGLTALFHFIFSWTKNKEKESKLLSLKENADSLRILASRSKEKVAALSATQQELRERSSLMAAALEQYFLENPHSIPDQERVLEELRMAQDPKPSGAVH